jgi:hypothetical protein
MMCLPTWETDGGGRISKSTPATVSSVTSRSGGGGFRAAAASGFAQRAGIGCAGG